MRKSVLILVLGIAIAFASCTSSRMSYAKTGCNMNKGFIGYGSR